MCGAFFNTDLEIFGGHEQGFIDGGAAGLEEILVVEEKRGLIEEQIKSQLYTWQDSRRPRVVGKHDDQGRELLPTIGELTPAMVARAIAARLDGRYCTDTLKQRLDFLTEKENSLAKPRERLERTPHFCSGCPHNTSTQVPEGSRALGGIGCHYMATWMDRGTDTFTQMGGEGVTWLGQAPFTRQKHVFQNLGDGTYFHSGTLAIRAAIASGANITYKILYNDAVAMTGGQDAVGGQTGLGVGNDDYIRAMLTQALGDDKAASLIDRILIGGNTTGLDTLKWMEPRAVGDIIRYEHPQIQAIVISYLDPDQAAEILASLDEKVRLDVMMRVASLESVQPQALQELNDILEKQFSGGSAAQTSRIGGVKRAADIMNFMDRSIEGSLMDAIKDMDPDLASTIEDLMFVFDNLKDVDDRGIQALLREVSSEVLVVALKGADDSVKEKIFKNMSKRAAELLQDDLEAKGPVRVSEVESAQKDIITIARRMAEAGEITLGGAGEEMM